MFAPAVPLAGGFVSTWNGNVETYVLRDFTNTLGHVAPNGTDVVINTEGDGNCEIYVMARDGLNPRRLMFNRARRLAFLAARWRMNPYHSQRNGQFDTT